MPILYRRRYRLLISRWAELKGKKKGKGQVRLYVPIYGCCTQLRPSAHEENRGYIQLLKLEAPSPLVKHSGKRSCCNSTPRHPRRRCRLLLLLRFLCFFFVFLDVARSLSFHRLFCGFLQIYFFCTLSLVSFCVSWSTHIFHFFLDHYLSLSLSLGFYFLRYNVILQLRHRF